MNQWRKMIPMCQRLGKRAVAPVPVRTFFSRRPLVPMNVFERQLDDFDRHFARLEREMNSAFRDWGFPLTRIRSFCEPQAGGTFPAVETETSPGGAGQPGKYLMRIGVGEGYSPDNIKVILKDNLLTIHAKFEKMSEDGKSRIYQEVSRSFTLPENIKPEDVKSLLTPDGILTIEAPLPELETEAAQPKEIPISIENKN